MNTSLLLSMAMLGSLFIANMGAPLINRRQTDADQPLCPESGTVSREGFSNTDDAAVCAGQCRLPRPAFAGFPFGKIVIVTNYDCCDGYTQQDSMVQGFTFTCVPTLTTGTTTAPPPNPESSAVTDSATTSQPSIVTILPTSAEVPACPSGRSVAQGEYISQDGVCEVRCQVQATFFLFSISFDVTSYECCEGYTRTFEGSSLGCILTESITASPAPTEPTVEEAVTESSEGPTDRLSTPAPTEASVPKCTNDDRTLSTYDNVEPNLLCEVQCFTQNSFAGASIGPKNEQTRYQCCDGYVAVKAYPNIATNYQYECVKQ